MIPSIRPALERMSVQLFNQQHYFRAVLSRQVPYKGQMLDHMVRF